MTFSSSNVNHIPYCTHKSKNAILKTHSKFQGESIVDQLCGFGLQIDAKTDKLLSMWICSYAVTHRASVITECFFLMNLVIHSPGIFLAQLIM